MRLSFSSSCCNSASSLALFPAARLRQHKGRWARMDSRSCRKEKLVAILGATGAGKSRLSVDIGCRFASEIINADKIQVYQGLDITTNKISMAERRGVPHHLLGEFDSNYGELSASDFRSFAGSVIKEMSAGKKLPIMAGGSNSFIHALPSDRYEPEIIPPELRYNRCFLWPDVQLPVLYEYLSKRVEDMLDMGIFPELAEFFDPVSSSVLPRLGLRKAIGVPELDLFFPLYPPEYNNFRSARPEGDLASTYNSVRFYDDEGLVGKSRPWLGSSGSVVKLWDGIGLGNSSGILTMWDLNRGEMVRSFFAGKGQIPAICMGSPAVAMSAGLESMRNAAVKVWDVRIGGQNPVAGAEWQPRRQRIVGIDSARGEKVYVRDDVSTVVRDLRNLSYPLPESEVQTTWFDTDTAIVDDDNEGFGNAVPSSPASGSDSSVSSRCRNAVKFSLF